MSPTARVNGWFRKHSLEIQEALSLLPDTRRTRALRRRFYQRLLAGCGENLWVEQHAILKHPHNLSLGSHVYVNRGAFIVARGEITIGDYTGVGPYAMINSGSHVYSDGAVPYRQQPHESEPIVIGRDVWIGAHACILKGSVLGDGCIVSSGAVVSGSVAPYAIVGGVPARKFGERPRPEEHPAAEEHSASEEPPAPKEPPAAESGEVFEGV